MQTAGIGSKSIRPDPGVKHRRTHCEITRCDSPVRCMATQDLVDTHIFEEAQQVARALDRHDCRPALEWCSQNSTKLKKTRSRVIFKLRLQVSGFPSYTLDQFLCSFFTGPHRPSQLNSILPVALACLSTGLMHTGVVSNALTLIRCCYIRIAPLQDGQADISHEPSFAKP